MLGFGTSLAGHMGLHIALMNGLAPLLVVGFLRYLDKNKAAVRPGAALAVSTILQQALLWGWHAPSVLAFSQAQPAITAAMHLSLLTIALLFWRDVLRNGKRWGSILALLVSAKLFCLLGILLTLSPRALYAAGHHGDPPSLADQQLAGLLMLTACPLSYLCVATLIATGWVREPQPARAGTR